VKQLNIKLGSLFDGIGTFPLSGLKYGFIPIWASEIEPFPIRVTQHHFPDMKQLGDITKVNGSEIEPVDAITFGSPCTRLSVAGRHDGFDITFECQGTKEVPHKIYNNKIRATDKYQYTYKDSCPICGKELIETNESALFFHAIRIISEMRDATNGTYPRFIVWENVPGAYSSNSGQDFRAVLEEITEAEIPMPGSGKWATAGMVRTERVDVAWRTLDAQHWGVPQRRRRIFLVADFGGQCAGEILFVEQGLRGNFAESGEAREEVAGDVGDGIEEPNCLTPWDVQSRRIFKEDGKWPTLYSHQGGGGTRGHVAKGIIPFDTTQITSPQNGNNPKPDDPCHPLCANAHVPNIAIPQAIGFDNQTGQSEGIEVSPSVRSESHGSLPCVASRINSSPEGIAGAVSSKWAKGTGGPAGDECYNLVVEPDKQFLFENHSQDTRYVGPLEVAPTVSATFGMGGNNQPFIVKAFTQNQREELRDLNDKAGALAAEPGVKQQTYVIQNATRGKSQNGLGISQDDVSYTLDSLGNHAVCIQGSMIGRADKNGPQGNGINEDVSFTLNTTDRHAVATRYAVRRLTPLECERLQGLPDNWTNIEGASDTARYKAIGNGIAKPCSDFVLSGIARVLKGVII